MKPLLDHGLTLSPRSHLGLGNLPQLVDLGRTTSHDALCHLHKPSNLCSPRQSIGCSDRLDPDDANARILWSTIVLAIAEIAQPGLERGRVVLADGLAVGEDAGTARNGGPLAGGVVEGDVDVRVLGQVVRLAGFGVGVEEEVDAAGLLFVGLSVFIISLL